MTAFLRHILIASATFALVAGAGAPAHAQFRSSFSGDQARNGVEEGQLVPLRDILRMLRDRFGGRQLDANLYSNGSGGAYYEIQWLTDDGQRIDFQVDARTGRILSQRGG